MSAKFQMLEYVGHTEPYDDYADGGAADINAALVESLEERDWAVWLREHAPEYGFILRYMKDKTDITGTSFEPWHYRYVGVEDAQKITAQGVCLEEYLGRTE